MKRTLPATIGYILSTDRTECPSNTVQWEHRYVRRDTINEDDYYSDAERAEALEGVPPEAIVPLGEKFTWTEFVDQIQAMIRNTPGATLNECTIEIGYGEFNSEPVLILHGTRLETDAEENKRERAEAAKQAKRLAAERKKDEERIKKENAERRLLADLVGKYGVPQNV